MTDQTGIPCSDVSSHLTANGSGSIGGVTNKDTPCVKPDSAVRPSVDPNAVIHSDIVKLDGDTVEALPILDPEDLNYRASREKLVGEAVSATIAAAKALREIKSYKGGALWRSEFKTFEAYCSAKWGYQKSQAYRLVESGDFVTQLEAYNQEHSPRGEAVALPVNESQIRVLNSIPKESRVAAWVAGIGNTPVDTLTGKAIAEKVKAHLPAKAGRVRAAPAPVEQPPVVVEVPDEPERMLDTLQTGLIAHPRVAEIHALIGQIKALLRDQPEVAPASAP